MDLRARQPGERPIAQEGFEGGILPVNGVHPQSPVKEGDDEQEDGDDFAPAPVRDQTDDGEPKQSQGQGHLPDDQKPEFDPENHPDVGQEVGQAEADPIQAGRH